MIGIIDYGLGNVRAFANVYKTLRSPTIIVRGDGDFEKVTKVILPGVGAFDYAMQKLDQSGMRPLLNEVVMNRKIPVLGVCVGMQIMARCSDEGKLPGFGWIAGNVKKFDFPSPNKPQIIPHMGWNNIIPVKNNQLLDGLDSDARFYFLHSYYFECQDTEDIIAMTDYGGKFACAVNSGNIFGIQFHPEKSHQWGVQILKNFLEI